MMKTKRPTRWKLAASVAFLSILVAPSMSSCGSGARTDALLNTALGVGAAAVQRSRGGCYSACLPGTACNRETGYCDPIPCGGRCEVNETCEPALTGGEHCVPVEHGDLPIERAPEPPALPVSPREPDPRPDPTP